MLFLCWNKNVLVGRIFVYYEYIISYIYILWVVVVFYLGLFFKYVFNGGLFVDFYFVVIGNFIFFIFL